MRQITTVDHLADLVLREVLAKTVDASSVADIIEKANPFGDHPRGRQIWTNAMVRNGVRRTQAAILG
jgi:hypothetical protein